MKKGRINLYLTFALFAVVSSLVGSSFYMWYIQGPADSACLVPDAGAHFWTMLATWIHDLGPKLTVFADTVYQYLVKICYQNKLNLLWKYYHKVTVLSITGLVVSLLLLFIIGLWISYSLGKRRGKREVLPDTRSANKKR